MVARKRRIIVRKSLRALIRHFGADHTSPQRLTRISGVASAFWGILDITGATMGTLQIPDHLKELIDRRIAEGRAASEAGYVVEALRAYAEHIEAESEIASMVGRADTDMAAGRFLGSPDDLFKIVR
jgi:Arc/MetJ-type ribon-helix-helix transcriptional regulator